MENRITDLFKKKNGEKVLSVFCTAGYPERDSILSICRELETSGVDLIEIGMPFSDPVADGPVIQAASERALANGMSIEVLFEQLADLRDELTIPVILMGYINPVLQFGLERFVEKSVEVGIDGVILPDLPVAEYREKCEELFNKNNLSAVFLVTPHTPEERVLELDEASSGFLYVVSTPSITGNQLEVQKEQEEYFARLKSMNLKNPLLVGFGISNRESYLRVCESMDGAIVGSAFIRSLEGSSDIPVSIKQFIQSIR